MSELTGVGAMIVEEPEGGGASGAGRERAPRGGPLRCGGCTLWPRQQTWLCVVPLLIGFIGLGLSLMLLKWIVVGSVQDYVPTDLVDAKGIGQDPIFLSKPSTVPKLPDTSTSTSTSISTTTTTTPTASNFPPGVTTTVRPRTRAGPRAGGQGASGSQVTPRSTTNRHATSTRGPPPTASSTTTTSSSSTAASPSSTPSPANPTILHDSTQTWTSQKVPVESTRPHVQVQTAKPTSPPLEHFKPCRDKDLAYCLNGGECFVIETLTGSHKNCRCKEGYQGVRCDQFLPKTDSILSDPTDHLGIEFMESEEIYKRQVLSVSCIAIGITLLGTICMALYYRNKRRREKLQAHLKSYSVSASGFVSKPNLRPQGNLQLQKYSKGNGSCPPRGAAGHNGFAQKSVASAAHSKVQTNGKHHRSGSVSHSPEQRSRAGHRAPSRRTPPISRGRLNHIGGPRDSGPAYQHLREAESSEREVESLKGRYSEAAVCEPGQDSYLNMQRPPCTRRASPPGAAPVVPCSRLDGPTVRASPGGFRYPPPHHSATPPPYRTCSVPIIPSVQGHYDDTSCMQTGRGGSGVRCPAAPGDARDRPSQARRHSSSSSSICSSSSSPSSLSKGAVQREAVALLLDEAQQQLRVLAHAHRKQEETGSAYAVARETACFLSPAGGEVGRPALTGPPETRLVNPSREPHRDSASPCE